MKGSQSRILTTHAGSLPRAPDLVTLQVKQFRGDPVDEGVLQQAIVDSTREVMRRQAQCGIDIGNNGEHSRESFFTYVQHRMSGFGGTSNRPVFSDMQKYPEWIKLKFPSWQDAVSLGAAPQAQAAVAYADVMPLQEELALFDSLLQELEQPFVESFVTAPSPGIIAAAMENRFYASLDDYIDALADALAVEYRAITAAGHVLQLDCPDLAMERHTYFAGASDEAFLEFVEKVISAIGKALEGIPRQQVRMHVCWGNYNGPHDDDVPLATILPSLVNARVGALMLSMANPRHAHEYRLLTPANLPDDIMVIAGVIDTTTNYVEHPQVVADRIVQVAETLGDPTRIIAGTDCGFDTAAGFRDVAEDVVWAKLEALAEGAALASQQLY
jgi:5-methyltetrahydropteroyltriglutamate--homocysteine methyltransferase